MIFDLSGTMVSSAFDETGNLLSQAYDIEGNPLLSVEPDIVVMTYNIQKFGGSNSSQVIQRILNTYNADVIGFQEVTTGSGTPTISGYPNVYMGTQLNKSALASKNPLSDVTFSLYTAIANETRGYNKGYIEVKGKTIAIFNTHLEAKGVKGGSAHNQQPVEFFNALQEEEYFIALGDFNVECHDIYDAEYTSVVKQFVDAGYHMANWTAKTGFVDTWFNGTTFEGSTYKCPCDNVITSNNIYLYDVIYDQSKEGSAEAIDHIPVIAKLIIN